MFRLPRIELLVIVLFVGSVWGAEELRVTFPDALVQQFNYTGKPGVVFERPSLFGIPSYRTSIAGPLVLSPNLVACTPLPQNASAPPGVPSVLYVDRGGDCTFTTKVRNAGNAGYQSVIVGDDRVESSLPYMADDGTTPAVTTPAVLISYADAQRLKQALASSLVTVAITYQMPNPDNRVEWDLWTTSADQPSSTFKHTFGRYVQALSNSSLFTPRMYTINGHTLGCDAQSRCGNQCSNGGLYCAIDPERDPRSGISGKDVIQENVRQMCIYQLLLNRSDTVQYLWFDYVTKFDSTCGAACPGTSGNPFSTDDPNCANGFSWNCSYAVMDSLGISSATIKQCVANSGGTESSDGHNTLLDAQISMLKDQGVFYIPTLIVNNAKYTGSLSCAGATNCGPLNAICAGFADATEPSLCGSIAQGCDIGQVKDMCGVCGGDSSSCKGCDGVPNSKKEADSCGVCDGPGTRLGGCLSAGALAGIFIAAIFGGAALIFGVWYYLHRQSRVMRDDIDSLLKQYLPLEGGINKGHTSTVDQERLVDDANDI